MFRKREVRMQMVKTPKTDEVPTQIVESRFPTIEQLTHTILLIGALYAAKTFLDTSSDIAMMIAESRIK